MRKASNDCNCVIATSTMVVRPAAGPLTLKCDRLVNPTTIPPTTPAIMPLNNGAPDANATPKQRGSATKNTTIDAGTSDDKLLI